MSKLHNLFALFLLIVLFAMPALVQAQEAESTEAPPVTVVIEAPNVDTSTGDISQIETVFAALFLVSLLINALQAFYLNKSVPSSLASQIFASARLLAALTPTTSDDKILEAGQKAYDALAPKVEAEEKPRD